MFVVSQTIFPIPILEGLGMRSPAAYILSSVNLVPFNYGRLFDNRPKVFLLETFGNILLTMPFGFGIPFLARFKPKSFPWIVISPGFAIETAQLLFCLLAGAVYRSVDINDVLMNTIGSLLGYALFRGFAKLYLAISDHLKLKQSGLFAYISEVARYTFV
jgi:glycopeptide antibiotics resistance protein